MADWRIIKYPDHGTKQAKHFPYKFLGESCKTRLLPKWLKRAWIKELRTREQVKGTFGEYYTPEGSVCAIGALKAAIYTSPASKAQEAGLAEFHVWSEVPIVEMNDDHDWTFPEFIDFIEEYL